MVREPDWEVLADIQFLIYKRVADSLNAALSAVALSDIPDAGGQPPTYWRERATTKVANVLNLFTAWEYLLRYKMGETIPERAVRPFAVNALLTWLSQQLQLSSTPSVESDPPLHGNQETLQEALLLLYSAAFTQGANVRLELETSQRGIWFRVQFARVRPLPATFDELLSSLGDHWRARDTVFELMMARDFVGLNGSELMLNSTATQGEFAFFIWRSGVKRETPPPLTSAQRVQPPAGAVNAVTQVMAETDLPDSPLEIPADKTLMTAELTPVLPPEVTAPMDQTRPPSPPRLADLRPPRFPLPTLAFGDETQRNKSSVPPVSSSVSGAAQESSAKEAKESPHGPEQASIGPLSEMRTPGQAGVPSIPERATDDATATPEGDDPLGQSGESPSPLVDAGASSESRVTVAHLSDNTPVIRLTPPRPGAPAGPERRAPIPSVPRERPASGAIIVPARIPRPEPPREWPLRKGTAPLSTPGDSPAGESRAQSAPALKGERPPEKEPPDASPESPAGTPGESRTS